MKLNYSNENLNKKNFFSEQMKIAAKKREIKPSKSFIETQSKNTEVFDSKTGQLLKKFKSAKEVSVYYNIDYRTLRRHIKSGKPLKDGKLIKYCL